MTKIKEEDLINNQPLHSRVRWNTFLPTLPKTLDDRQKTARKSIQRREETGPPIIRPFRREVAENPVLLRNRLAALPAIAISELALHKKAWKNIIFVLGGPGSGKGTNCERLAIDLNYAHISAGDLLREEAATNSTLGNEINRMMKEGEIVRTVC